MPNLTQHTWTNHAGESYSLKSHRFDKPLGKNVLILDVDNRIGKTTQVGTNAPFLDFESIDQHSAGFLNHYLYAKIHGYAYQAVIPEYDINDVDINPTWIKIPAIQQALREYPYVIFLDSDAIFRNLELPLEWMLNHWGIEPHTILSAAEVPGHGPKQLGYDGNPNLNTGFIVAQRTAHSETFFQKWLECPMGKSYRGTDCERFRFEKQHEQGALSILRSRAPFDQGAVKALACDEANQRPGKGRCDGTLVIHAWSNKRKIAEYVAMSIARVVMGRVSGLWRSTLR